LKKSKSKSRSSRKKTTSFSSSDSSDVKETVERLTRENKTEVLERKMIYYLNYNTTIEIRLEDGLLE
jgi:hypothetical protein